MPKKQAFWMFIILCYVLFFVPYRKLKDQAPFILDVIRDHGVNVYNAKSKL